MRCCNTSMLPSREALRAPKIDVCEATSSVAFAPDRLAGKSIDVSSSRSAKRRASRACSATNCELAISSCASGCVSSISSSASPASTTSPFCASIEPTKPPSKCCTAFLYVLTVTWPGACAAPSRGAIAAQPPNTTKTSIKTVRPMRRGISMLVSTRSSAPAACGLACRVGKMGLAADSAFAVAASSTAEGLFT